MSSVAELCDLSHYNDVLAKSCRTTPTYANTMTLTAVGDEGKACTSSSPNCKPGSADAPASTINVTSTVDQNSHNQKTSSAAEVHTGNQSCQDAASGQHKIVKQVSTSSIQVSEGNSKVKKMNRKIAL